MSVSFGGIGEVAATFLNNAASPAAVGAPVRMSGVGEVAAAGSGERFCGIALSSVSGASCVRLGGYVTAAYSGTAPAVGYVKLAGDGAGGVAVNAAGGEYLVAEVDTAAKTVGFFM